MVSHQLAAAVKERRIAKRAMAEMMHTSRAQLDRLLDPGNPGATLETVARAAKLLGRELRLELV